MADNLKEAAKLMGSLGGNRTLKKYGKKHFKRIRQIGIQRKLEREQNAIGR